MLTISDEAVALIANRNQAVFLDMHKELSGCCFNFQECPTVRFGKPKKPDEFRHETIRDVSVYVPHRLPEQPLEIVVSSFLGIKKLVLKGWKLI